MSAPILEFRNVSVSFDDQPVLSNVTFTLSQGEMIFLTGASGSGKSILLRLAIGLLKPDEGTILVNGQEIGDLDESELLAIRGGSMGIVFQEESLFTGYSVYDNAAYRLEDHGWAESDIEISVGEVLKFVGLENESEKFPEELSGGMKRRLEIARALIGWPSIMLFDEPTLSLDPIVAVQILDLIIRARDINKISSLYVTKKLQEIPYLAKYRAVTNNGEVSVTEVIEEDLLPLTKVILLESGHIAFQGSVDDFESSKLPAVTRMLEAFEVHAGQLYVADPWDKSRVPGEKIL